MKPIKLNRETCSKLFQQTDNVLLDCDGVIWSGGENGNQQLFYNADKTVEKLKSLGKKVFLVTNNSLLTHKAFMEKCKGFKLNIDEDSAVCAPMIMAQYLKNINFKKKVYVVGTEGLAAELKSRDIQCVGPNLEEINGDMYDAVQNGKLNLDPDVGAVVVGFDASFNYAKILKASCYLSNPECLFLANNIDEKYPVLNTPFNLPAGGVLVRTIEIASGRKATVIGKPSSLMFEVLASKYDLQPERTLMVGDTLATDVVFGNKCGLQTLLVLSGVSNLQDVERHKAEADKNQEHLNFVPHYYSPLLGDILEFL